MSISHIHSSFNNIRKIIHHTINVTSTEAKLFAIKYGINQVIQIPETTHIVIITDAIHPAECIFDFSIHPYQFQSIAIVKNLRLFFLKHLINAIEFWYCPSNDRWLHYHAVDKDMKKFNLSLLLPYKEL